jgi:hypothetical protein
LAGSLSLKYGMPFGCLPYVRRVTDSHGQNVRWMLASAAALPIFFQPGFETLHRFPVLAEQSDSCRVHRPGGEE